MIQLRDGSETEDRRLDRLLQFDERSKLYPVRERIDATSRPKTAKTWRLTVRNDQGQDGACVGFGTGHRLAAEPVEVSGVDYKFSMALYNEAKKLDPWPGEDYEGTSVLAGIQAAKARGRVGEYRWCFTLQDYIDAILTEGPVLVGTWWKDSMWDPGIDGFLNTSGKNVGGHCFILRGVDLRRKAFKMTNSWGKTWGQGGDAWISFESWERDLMPDGEGAVLYETKLRPTKPPGGGGSSSGGGASSARSAPVTASGLSLDHWWIRGR
jgi:hypothetical protein